MQKLNPGTFLATFFGIGFIPFAPGTFGSLAALALYVIMPGAVFASENFIAYLTGMLVFILIGVLICNQAEQSLGHDAGSIVIDEVAGYFVAVFLLPKTLLIALAAFVLFRLFDIWKPYPISRSQNLAGGWGVMIDDILAGIVANLILQIAVLINPNIWSII
jgi:phosphatidylglycerophosphatase A